MIPTAGSPIKASRIRSELRQQATPWNIGSTASRALAKKPAPHEIKFSDFRGLTYYREEVSATVIAGAPYTSPDHWIGNHLVKQNLGGVTTYGVHSGGGTATGSIVGTHTREGGAIMTTFSVAPRSFGIAVSNSITVHFTPGLRTMFVPRRLTYSINSGAVITVDLNYTRSGQSTNGLSLGPPKRSVLSKQPMTQAMVDNNARFNGLVQALKIPRTQIKIVIYS